MQAAKCGDAEIDSGLHAGFIGHISLDESGMRPKFSLLGDSRFLVDVSEYYAGAIGDEHFGSGGTEARATTGDEENRVLDLHDFLFRR